MRTWTSLTAPDELCTAFGAARISWRYKLRISAMPAVAIFVFDEKMLNSFFQSRKTRRISAHDGYRRSTQDFMESACLNFL